MNFVERIQAPVPKFFRIVRALGLVLAAAGGAILASPVVLPAVVISAGGYLVVAGTVMSAISQTTVSENNDGNKTEGE